MVVNDPIGDMLTRLRNSNKAFHQWTELPSSKIKKEIARVLKEEGFIEDFQAVKKGPFEVLRLKLKYGEDRRRAINGVKRISRPGLRIYVKKDEVPKVLGGIGVALLSTSNGVMTDRQARELGVGGEVICYLW